MKKSKISQPRDRLSELPDSLIFDIFWFLPMTDVVRTTILSKRWKNLWTTTPYLNFSYENDEYVDEDDFPSFVNLALLSWRGIKIQKFKIDHPGDWSLSKHFDVWLRLAVDKNVEELYVHWREMQPEAYLVPQCLYSCSSLKVLSMEGCDLKIKGIVKWNQLKSLRIKRVCLVGCERVFQKVMCGSPQLEVLILALCDNEENLSIRSNSLKKLSIDNYVQDCKPSEDSFHTVLKIWSPNLETLEISGVPYSKCLLLDVSSLTDATLGFYGVGLYELFDDPCIFWEILRHIISAIHHVERLTLSDWCIKVFEDIETQSFLNVKFLKLHAFCEEYEQIVNLLEIFPKLNMLVLQNENENEHLVALHNSLKFDAESCLEFEANIPKSFLRQLRTFEITWKEDDNSIFPFIEIVLKYASKLEKMVMRVIRAKEIMPSSDSLFLASKKLLGMPRCSPNCRVSVL